MSTFAWIVLGLGLVLLALLATPIEFTLRLRSDDRPKFLVMTSFFGGRTPPVRIGGAGRKTAKAKPKAKGKGRLVLNWPAAPAAVKTLLSDLRRVSHFEWIRVDGSFGLGDPADTGQLYGHLVPFIYGVSGLPRTKIILRPNFERTELSGTLDACFRVTPIAVIGPFFRVAWRLFGPFR
jgi:hypothetical protein